MDNTYTTPYDGQEINLVLGQHFTPALSAAVNLPCAWFAGQNGAPDSYGTDARLFVTYRF